VTRRAPRAALALALLAACAGEDRAPAQDCGVPGAGWVAYTTRRAGSYDVRLVREDGRCDRALADGPDDELDGSLSAQAGLAVHWARREGAGRIVVTELASGAERVLDTGDLVVGNPAVSPDGLRVAFEGARPPARADVYVMPVAGGAPEAVAADPALDAGPAWAAGGAVLFFGSSRGGSYQLWRVNADGTGLAQVTRDAASALSCGAAACPVNGRPAPSPGGGEVAFTRVATGARSRVVVLDVAGGAERVLADATDAEPSFSADGARIAAMNLDGGDAEVILRDAATGALVRRLTSSPGLDGSPACAR